MADELPKHQLLVKLMGMTQSDNDGEALVALRKANTLLKAAGWTWERVLEGKIKVVENPFAGIANPFERKPVSATPTPAPPKPTPTYRPVGATYVAPTPPAWHTATLSNPLSTVRNKFANFCYCCGKDTPAQQGWLFDPWTYVKTATSKWQVACGGCNTSGVVHHYAATPRRTRGKASISDLS